MASEMTLGENKESTATIQGFDAIKRDALEELIANIEMRSATFGLNVMVDTKTFLDAKAALAKPLRNCDVGTAVQQRARFDKFCDSHSDCAACPLAECDDDVGCAFAFMQRPYENEVANEQ